jgi:hypothetical protein
MLKTAVPLDAQDPQESLDAMESVVSRESQDPRVFLEPPHQSPSTPMGNVVCALLAHVVHQGHVVKRDPREHLGPPALLEVTATQEAQDHWDHRDLRERRAQMDSRDPRDQKGKTERVGRKAPEVHPDLKVSLDPRDGQDLEDSLENLANREPKVQQDHRVHRAHLDRMETQDPRDQLESLVGTPAIALAHAEPSKPNSYETNQEQPRATVYCFLYAIFASNFA